MHLGGTLDEIAAAEEAVTRGGTPSGRSSCWCSRASFDPTRAPAGKHTAWAYCHVPERLDAGHDRARSRRRSSASRPASATGSSRAARWARRRWSGYNPNYVGGDINGGVQDLRQLYTRPVARPTRTRRPIDGLYICSSSTPPGGGVHGMCGYFAARAALRATLSLMASKASARSV